MSKGIQFLMKKNKIDVIMGTANVKKGGQVEVNDTDGGTKTYTAKHTILATGARSRELPNLKQDGNSIIGYREAMSLEKHTESLALVGPGAIGVELAYLLNAIHSNGHGHEYLDRKRKGLLGGRARP